MNVSIVLVFINIYFQTKNEGTWFYYCWECEKFLNGKIVFLKLLIETLEEICKLSKKD